MKSDWLITMKPTFQTEWLALQPKESHQILEKLTLLAQDPTPDAKVKKQLKYLNGKLHRIRSGHYRIFYTFEHPYISLLALRRREDDTYDEDFDAEFLGGLDPELRVEQPSQQPNWEKIFAPKEPEKTPLPEPITAALLENLHVPPECHERLVRMQTREDLLSCPGIPDEILLKLDEYLFEKPLVEVLQQPEFVAGDVSDLLRFKEGELLGFLLRLSPEQEKFVDWSMQASGPTLLKGGPGTGKSTIAIYRVRSLLNSLRKAGINAPRILFTTYTNALVAFSHQLLESLLGEEARQVEVRTTDKVAVAIAREQGNQHNLKFATQQELRKIIKAAGEQANFDGNALQKRAQARAVAQLHDDYLLEEINGIITARQLMTLEDYLKTPRPGRKVPLNATQRAAVWKVHQAYLNLLQQAGLMTWQQVRALAAEIVLSGRGPQPYDAVVIDEAQDLDPSLLRMLTGLCREANRLFITADANQSIYGAGFHWNEVHERLQFRGRTGILKSNYRSTREIGEAAHSYLAAGALDDLIDDRAYANNGPQPAVRAVDNAHDEAELLARFLPGAAREFRLGLSSCAVFCPTEAAGKDIATRLTSRGLEATFMTGHDLDLKRSGVKVITLKSSKGLEFPVAAVAGFVESNYPAIFGGMTKEETDEVLARERRTMFVSFTRAMRALLVIVPNGTTSPLLKNFDPMKWNLGENR